MKGFVSLESAAKNTTSPLRKMERNPFYNFMSRKREKGGKPSDFVMLYLVLAGNKQPQAAGRRPDLADLGYPAQAALVLLVVFGAGEGVGGVGGAGEDRGVGSGADVELGELIELDVNRIRRVTLTLSLDLAGLIIILLVFDHRAKKFYLVKILPALEAWRSHRWPKYGLRNPRRSCSSCW